MISKDESDFLASGEILSNDINRPVTLYISLNEHQTDPPRCIVVPNSAAALSSVDDGRSEIIIRGKTDDGSDIAIRGFEILSSINFIQKWEGYPQLLIKGNLSSFVSNTVSVWCDIFLPPTPLITTLESNEFHFDGSVTMTRLNEDNEIRWIIGNGKAKLVNYYRWFDDKVHLDSATVRVKQSHLTLDIETVNSVSPESLVIDLQTQIEDSLWLISFLSHKRIDWYAATISITDGDSEPEKPRELMVRRNCWLGHRPTNSRDTTWFDLPIKTDQNNSDLFQRLYANYINHPKKDTLRKAIGYLLTSYEPGYLPTHLGAAYVGLESMVSGFAADDDPELGALQTKSAFKAFKKQLSDFIDTVGLNDQISDSIKGKIGELNRRSYFERLIGLIRRHKVPLEMIWPADSFAESDLREIISRRNKHIHGGNLYETHAYRLDAIKVKMLVELWILTVLGCKEQEINKEIMRRWMLWL